MCSPLWSVYSRRVSTYPGSRSRMLRLLVSRRFQLFILCLIAPPLVINHLTPELITTSIISWVLHNCYHLFFLALSRAEALAA